MQIRPTNNVQTTSPVNLQTQNRTSQATSSSAVPVDQLDISPEAQLISQTQAAESNQIRSDRVETIRTEIASGQYETPEKMEAALTRLLDELA